MNKALVAAAAAVVAASPLGAQKTIAYEGGLLAHTTKFDKVTTLDNGFGLGIHLDAYLLPRLALDYSADFASSHSVRTGTDLTVVNHRIDLVYNQPLTGKWRALLGGGWTGTRFNGDKTKNEYDSGLNALIGLRYCVNDNWSWKTEGLADFKDPADQAPAFSKSTAYTLRFGISRFFGGQAKNGPCVAKMMAEPMPAPPPAAVTTPAPAPAQQQPPAAPPARQEPPPQAAAAPAPAAQPAAPVQRALRIFSPIYFAFDKAVLTKASRDTLDTVVRFLNENPNAKIEVIGYTDSLGTSDYNSRLGARRATAARDYIVSKGIAASRITTVTRGQSDPAADNGTPEGRAKNRRAIAVEVR